MIYGAIKDVKLASSYTALMKLIESPEWADIKAFIGVYHQMQLEELALDEDEAILKSQGRVSVLREIAAQLENSIFELADVDFSRQLDEFDSNYDEEV